MKAGKQVKGCLWKQGWVPWCRWGGARSKVSPPSDISCAREAVTTRSAEVQVSERRLTDKAKRDLSTVHPDWAFYPPFPPSPCHSAMTHPSLRSYATLFTLFTLLTPAHRTPACDSLIVPSSSPPVTFFFTPLAKHCHRFSLSRPSWLGQLSVGCICLQFTAIHSHRHTLHIECMHRGLHRKNCWGLVSF